MKKLYSIMPFLPAVLVLAACSAGGGVPIVGPNTIYTPEPIYAAAEDGLYVDPFGWPGKWTSARGLASDRVWSVVASGKTIYAGTSAGLSMSTNGGESFTTPLVPPGDRIVRGLTIAGGKLYAACYTGGLWVSDVGSSTFTRLGQAAMGSGNDINDVAVTADTIYVGTGDGIYASPVGSDAFQLLASIGWVQDIHVARGKVYAAASYGIYVSDDADGPFVGLPIIDIDEIPSVEVHGMFTSIRVAEGNGLIYVGSGYLYISSDGGQTFRHYTYERNNVGGVNRIFVTGEGENGDVVYAAGAGVSSHANAGGDSTNAYYFNTTLIGKQVFDVFAE